MSSLLARLNLRPQEQRLIVVVGAVLFVVLNVWLVRPHFRDWGRVQAASFATRATLADYQNEVANIPKYREKLKYLESQGSAVLPAEQAVKLTITVQNQASQAGVQILQTTQLQIPRSGPAGTNQFFEEQAIKISVNTGEKELVNFLHALGSGNSMIRVRDMDLRPDPGSGRTRLLGGVTLVASYQKKAEPKTEAKTNASKTTASKTNALKKVEQKKTASKTNALRRAESKRTEPTKSEPPKAKQPPPTSNKL
ncbi:MAG: type 4a pilus biogenesis protein PilO [Limisphaerales bacterium]